MNDQILNTQKDRTVLILSMMMFLAPAMGVPSEEMLQDTLKSILISLGTLISCLTFLWYQRNISSRLQFPPVLLLPMGLCLYAIGSMWWSHSYLGGAEAIRWFIFGLLLWLGVNTFTLWQVPRLALAIHAGGLVASIWTALQFWFDFKYFPQGPNPASTFVNRNFFAEYILCALPYSVFLLVREKEYKWITLLAISMGFNIAALMMTGTRSAFLGLVIFIIILAFLLYRYWHQIELSKWGNRKSIVAIVAITGVLLVCGLIPTNNAQIIDESGGNTNAISREFKRAISITKPVEYTEGSFSIRTTMWLATARMIGSRPLSGVGAGAWEVHVPLYQSVGTQIETDYYAHNEILQLVAEYGIVGWLFLVGLVGYLVVAVRSTWIDTTPEGRSEAPLRALTLSSLLMLFIVCAAGFPWRLAATGAIFAVSLSVIAASDIRLGYLKRRVFVFQKWHTNFALLLFGLLLTVGLYICEQAWACEQKLVRSVKLALTISKSGQPNHPQWNNAKNELLKLVGEGVAINSHYRKLTPMVADELASWGDWNNAIWIWESILKSRPNIVVIAVNISRGYLEIGDYEKALEYLARATKLQPTATSVRSLQVIFLTRIGEYTDAARIARGLFAQNAIDYDMVYAAYLAGIKSHDWGLAIQTLEIRIKRWPSEAYDGWLKLGDIYNNPEHRNESKALESYRAAILAAPTEFKERVLSKIPSAYRLKL